MSLLIKRFCWLLCIGWIGGQTVEAQAPASRRPRTLAPGVITIIKDANIDDDTRRGPREFSELLQVVRPRPWQPNFEPTTQTLLEKAKSVTFRQDVWSLEFGFKPLRIIRVGGRDIWYLVYYVRNDGDARSPRPQADQTYALQTVARPVEFIPTFIFQSHELEKAYYDVTLPDVVRAIALKERLPGPLYDSSTIGGVEIQVSTPNDDRRVWGVATWDDVDPETDFISIYVQGLTNAFQWQPPRDGYKQGVRGEQDVVTVKTLQLNFWRPGDEIDLRESEIRYGIPLYPSDEDRQQDVLKAYQLTDPVEYQWVFR